MHCRKWSDKAGIIIQGSLHCLSYYACQVLTTKPSGECVAIMIVDGFGLSLDAWRTNGSN